MSDIAHYENPELWTEDRFTQAHEVERFRTCFSLIPPTTTSLLDVGCGNGAFMAFLENRKVPFTLTGLERSEAARQSRVCQAEIHSGSVDNLPFEDRSFDLVAAMEVIEHLPYGVYEKSLQEIQRVAKKHILISVPYREKRQFVECPYCNCQFNPNYHMRSFNEAILEKVFPAFRLAALTTIATDDYVLAPILRSAYHLISKNKDFPKTAVCPHCGFTGRQPENQTVAPPTYQIRSRLRDRWKDKLPKYRRLTWFAALYERTI
jgi:ubiquinone/menaquinone biosynthesis C-methylase UbiE